MGLVIGTLVERTSAPIAPSVSLTTLKRLELNLGVDEELAVCSNQECGCWQPAQWVRKLTNLEELSIKMSVTMSPRCDKAADIFLFLLGVPFPRLRKLDLKYVRMTYATIHDFVEAHRETVRSLTIEEPQIEAEDWGRFCAQEKELSWRLEGKHLRLTEVYSGAEVKS